MSVALLLFFGGVGLVAHEANAARPAASFSAAQSLYAASSSPGNSYVAGASVVLTAPVAGDFSAFGGSIITGAPVTGDDLLVGGSIHSRAPVMGDVRALGGNVIIDQPIKGDLASVSYTLDDEARVGGSVFVTAANATLANGASGPVTIYGNNIALGGTFDQDVVVHSSGRLTLAASTTISGRLSYESPEPAVIPASATILGGVSYTNASYLPTLGTSRVLILLNMGFFLFVRFLGALLLAGLIAGLFPWPAEQIVERVSTDRPRDLLLTTLLGFAVAIVTPILCVILMLTFIGIGLAFLIGIAYALLMMMALLYAGTLVGAWIAHRYARRETILWRDGVVGMLIFSLVALIPFIGTLSAGLFALFVAGALLQLLFHIAFPGETYTPEML